MKKWIMGIVAVLAMVALVGCPQDNGNGSAPPPDPEVLEWIDVVPGGYWRPFYLRAYLEAGLPRAVEENGEPDLARLLEAYCQEWGPLVDGEGEVTAYLDMDENGIIFPWEAVYEFDYAFDGTYLTVADWDIPFSVSVAPSGEVWTMRLDADDVGFADFLDDLGLEGYAYVEIDFEPCGFEPGDVVDECLPAGSFIPDPDSEDNWETIGDELHTENNQGFITGTAAFPAAITVGGNLGAVFSMEYRYDDLNVPEKNGTPEFNKFYLELGAYEFEVKPHTDRVRINPSGQGYAVNIKKGGVILDQAVISPFEYSAVRKWLGVEIMMSEDGVGMRVEVAPGKFVVAMVPGEDASGVYSSVKLTHRTGTDENVNDYQMAFRDFCYENIPVQCGCE